MQNHRGMRRLLIIPILVPTVAFGQAVTFGLGARPQYFQARSANFISSFSAFYPQAGVSIPAGGGGSMGSAPLVIAPPPLPTAPTGNLPATPIATPIANTPSTGGPNVVLPSPVLPNPNASAPINNINNNVSANPGLPPNVIGMPGGFNGGTNQPINGGFNGTMPIMPGQMPGQPPIIAGPLTGGGQQFPQFPMYQQPYMPMPRPYYPGYGRQQRNSGFSNFAQILGGLASAFLGGGGGSFGGAGFGGVGFGNAGFSNAGYNASPVRNFYTPKTSQVSQPGPFAQNDAAPDEYAEPASVATAADSEVAAARDAKPAAAPDEYADASCDDCDAGVRKNPSAPEKLPTAPEAASVATEADDAVTEAAAATPGAMTAEPAKAKDSEACVAKTEADRLLCAEFNKAWAAKGFKELKLSAALNESAQKHAADIAKMMKAGKEFDSKVKDRTNIKSGFKGSDGSTVASRFQKLGILKERAQIVAWYPGDAKTTASKALADWSGQDWKNAGTVLKYAGVGHSTIKNKDGQTITVWTMVYSSQLPKTERAKNAK